MSRRPEPLMTTAEVAEYLKLHEVTIRKKVAGGEIPYVKVGTQTRFRRSEIDRWTEDQAAQARAESA